MIRPHSHCLLQDRSCYPRLNMSRSFRFAVIYRPNMSFFSIFPRSSTLSWAHRSIFCLIFLCKGIPTWIHRLPVSFPNSRTRDVAVLTLVSISCPRTRVMLRMASLFPCMSVAWSITPSNSIYDSFCSLIREISRVRPHKVQAISLGNNQTYPAREIFRRWLDELKRLYTPLPSGTTATVFKLLFPEEDHHRKYNMQETRLAEHLAECFGLNSRQLQQWCEGNSSGCLGEELKLVLRTFSTVRVFLIHPLPDLSQLLDCRRLHQPFIYCTSWWTPRWTGLSLRIL